MYSLTEPYKKLSPEQLQECGFQYGNSHATQLDVTDVQNSTPDILKLASGDPVCWQVLVTDKKAFTKRQVVITDFSLRDLNILKKAILSWIGYLLAERFSFYVWTDTTLIPINSLNDLYIQAERIQPISTNTLIGILENQKVCRDRDGIKIVDYFEGLRIQSCLASKKPAEPCLPMTIFTASDYLGIRIAILESIPPQQFFNLELQSDDMALPMTKTLLQLPQLTGLKLDLNNYTEKISRSFLVAHGSKITHLKISKVWCPLKEFLPFLTHLHTLELKTPLHDEDYVQIVSLTGLKKIKLHEGNWLIISYLLTNNCLETLHLREMIEYNMKIKSTWMKNLSTLTISSSPWGVIKQFLDASSKLKKIVLKNSQISSEMPRCPLFVHLKEVQLLNIVANDRSHYLSFLPPGLEKLTLDHSFPTFLSALKNLPHLKTVEAHNLSLVQITQLTSRILKNPDLMEFKSLGKKFLHYKKNEYLIQSGFHEERFAIFSLFLKHTNTLEILALQPPPYSFDKIYLQFSEKLKTLKHLILSEGFNKIPLRSLRSIFCPGFIVNGSTLTILRSMTYSFLEEILTHPGFTIEWMYVHGDFTVTSNFSKKPFTKIKHLFIKTPSVLLSELLDFTPQLRSLALKDTHFSLPPHPLPFLEKLSLLVLNDDTVLRPSIKELKLNTLSKITEIQSLLEAYPHLEFFEITNLKNVDFQKSLLDSLLSQNYFTQLKRCYFTGFNYVKNQVLCVDFLTDEETILKLLQQIEFTEWLSIKQPLPLEKVSFLMRPLNLHQLNLTLVVSDSRIALVDVAIHLLKTHRYLSEVSLLLYQQNLYFTLHTNKKSILKCNTTLTTDQLFYFLSRYPLNRVKVQSLSGSNPLTETKPLLNVLTIDDHKAFLRYNSLFLPTKECNFSSSSIHLSEQAMILHGNKFDKNILQFYKNNKIDNAKKLVWHFPKRVGPTLPSELYLLEYPFKAVELIMKTIDKHLIRFFIEYYLMQKNMSSLTVKDDNKQILFILQQDDEIFTFSGPSFTQDIMNLLPPLDYSMLYFKDFHVPPHFHLPKNTKCSILGFKNSDVTKDFFYNLPKDMGQKSYLRVSLLGCPFIKKEELNGFFKRAAIDALPYSMQSKHESSASYLDGLTGEQPLENAFLQSKLRLFQSACGQDPELHYFRLEINSFEQLNCKRVTPPKMNTREELRTLFTKHGCNPKIFISMGFSIQLKSNKNISLPSLSPNETILGLYTSQQVSLYYSNASNLYYFKSKKNCTIEFDLVIEAHIQVTSLTKSFWKHHQHWFPCLQNWNPTTQQVKPYYHSQFNALMLLNNEQKRDIALAFVASFETEELSKSVTSGNSLCQVIKERRGVCRHKRAVLELLISKFSIKGIRLVASEDHDFAEMFQNGKWHMICMGGVAMPEIQQEVQHIHVKNISTNKSPSILFSEPVPLPIPGQSITSKNVSPSVIPEMTHSLSSTIPLNALMLTPSSTIFPNAFNHPIHPIPLQVDSFSQLCKQILQKAKRLEPGAKNLLIQFSRLSQIEQFHASMALAISTKHQYLFIESLHDLRPTELQINTQGYIRTKSHIHNELRTAQAGDVCVIPISDYSGKTINTLNALVDTTGRTIGGIPVAQDLIIIAVVLNVELEIDILSRFKHDFYTVPLLPEQDLLAPFCVLLDSIPEESLNFYSGACWQKHLPGTPKLEGDRLIFASGELMKQDNLFCFNLPLHIQSVRFFLLNLFYTRRFYANGQYHCISTSFTIYHAEKAPQLECASYLYKVNPFHAQTTYDFVLNRTTFFQFFENYYCKGDTLKPHVGWLEKIKRHSLSILVTDSMDEFLLCELLDAAKHLVKKNRSHFKPVKDNEAQLIIFSFAPEVHIPQVMQHRIQSILKPFLKNDCNNLFVVSKDIDFTVAQWLHQYADIFFIPINTNSRFSELFEGFNLKSQNKKDNKSLPVIWKTGLAHQLLLAEKNTVILKGTPSEDIQNKLLTLFLPKPWLFINNKRISYKGKLILLTDDTLPWHIPYQRIETRWNDYHAFLNNPASTGTLKKWKNLFKAFLSQVKRAELSVEFNFHQYQQMFRLYSAKLSNPFLPFLRFRKAYPKLASIALELCPEAATTHPLEQREAELDLMLKLFHCVLIKGPSDAGKSTFVLHYLQSKPHHKGLVNLKKWVLEGGILFLDSIQYQSAEVFDVFQCMLQTPRYFIMDQTIYKLDKNHALILVANWEDSDQIQLSNVLQSFPVLHWYSLPDEYLKNVVLLPVLQSAPCHLENQDALDIAEFFIKIRHRINTAAPTTPWTPRNLQSILLRFSFLYSTQKTQYTPKQIAAFSLWDELENNLETGTKQLLHNELKTQFPVLDSWRDALNRQFFLRGKAFTLTQCRKDSYRIIFYQIRQEQLKIQYPELARLSAFPGVLLQGPSGTGKSHTIIKALEMLGFQNGALPKKKRKPGVSCYHVISSEDIRDLQKGPQKDLSRIEKRLTQWFHKGDWVVIDELNTMPELKKILQAFLSGEDLSGKHPANPGFRLFVTQNPPTFIGRKQTEFSFQNYFFSMKLPEYSKKGLKEMAEDQGVHCFSNTLAGFFTERKKNPHSIREMTTRDFLQKTGELGFFARLTKPLLQNTLKNMEERDKKALACTSTVYNKALSQGIK